LATPLCPSGRQGVDWANLRKWRVERLRHEMKEYDLDTLVMVRNENVRYTTDCRYLASMFFVTRFATVLTRGDEPVLMVGHADLANAKRSMPWIKDIRAVPFAGTEWAKAVEQVLNDYKATDGKIGLDTPHSVHGYEQLKKECSKAAFVDATEPILSAKAVKSDDEVKIMREATAIADTGVQAALEAAKPGVREFQAGAAGVHAMGMNGAEWYTFAPLCVSGENTAFLQRYSSERMIRQGDLFLVDLGCIYYGYCAEYTRTKIIGRPNEKQKEIYRTVYESHMKAIEMIKPAVHPNDIDRKARRIIEEAGYGKYQHEHETGHGIGTSLYELPTIGTHPAAVILKEKLFEKNMIVCVEPGIFHPEIGGVRLEDIVLVTDTGHEFLSKVEYDDKLLAYP